MSENMAGKGEGTVIRVQGAIVDVRFTGEVPGTYEALTIDVDGGGELVLETEFQFENFEVRTLALGSTIGLKRGAKVLRTFGPIKVPVGEATLGRIFNV